MTIAAKAIKKAIESGRNVQLKETIVRLRRTNKYHYNAVIDGTEYEVSTRSFNAVKYDAKNTDYKDEGIATVVVYSF